MIWYCGYCSRWNKSGFRVCPTCSRPPKGRLCRGCKEIVPKDATYCTRCGGSRLTPAAVKKLPFSRPARVGLLVVGAAGVGLLVWLLVPVIQVALLWVCRLAVHVLFLAICFWLLTGLLPRPLGAKVRGCVWGFLCFLWRFAANLVQ